MKKKPITKKRMAELMQTSRAQLDRILDPENGSATIESRQRAAQIVGRELRLELVGVNCDDSSDPHNSSFERSRAPSTTRTICTASGVIR